ncbi:MAG: transposase [Christensenellaceae bacterium]|nr:transposase [Christensenellaceae bacterium]
MSKFINAYKSASGRIVKKSSRKYTKVFGKNILSPSFCLLTASGAPIEVIKRYIKSQGKCI